MAGPALGRRVHQFAVLLVFLTPAAPLVAQSILTVVGGGPSGDGRPAMEAILRLPKAMALDVKGNLFVGDTQDNRVRRVDATTGVITTYAGGGTAARATAAQPRKPRRRRSEVSLSILAATSA